MACSSPFGSADRSGRRPEVRQGGQRHGPRASLPASKASLHRFPKMTGRDWRVPVRSVRLTDLGGHGEFAGAGKDARGPDICAFQSPSGVLGLCRVSSRHRELPSGNSVSVPFRGLRGLQEPMCDVEHMVLAIMVSVPFRGFRGLQGGNRHAEVQHRPAVVSVPFRGFRGSAGGQPSCRSTTSSGCSFSPLPGF